MAKGATPRETACAKSLDTDIGMHMSLACHSQVVCHADARYTIRGVAPIFGQSHFHAWPRGTKVQCSASASVGFQHSKTPGASWLNAVKLTRLHSVAIAVDSSRPRGRRREALY